MENFVRDYGTGNEIPDPPKFISYDDPEPGSSASARQAPRYANFPRTSNRTMGMSEVLKAQVPEEEPTDAGLAGFGAGGGEGLRNGDASVTDPGALSSSPVNGIHDNVSPTSAYSQSQPTHSRNPSQALSRAAQAQADPSVKKTMISIGGNAYEVDPDQDPQGAASSPSSGTGPGGRVNVNANIGKQNDPLAEHMERLWVSAQAQGTGRRNSFSKPGAGAQSSSPAPSAGSAGVGSGAGAGAGVGSSALSAPTATRPANANRDYRNSAELVVGGPPPSSRPTSPAGPPVPAHMLPPQQTSSSPLPVEEVLQGYGQALPGERRLSINRGTSPGAGFVPSHSPNQSLGQGINRRGSVDERPRSREGFAGIGALAGGRTPSPGPSQAQANGAPQTHPHPYRIPSPAAPGSDLGISLDASGQVTHDRMAEAFRQQQQQQQQAQYQPVHSPYNHNPPQPQRQQSIPSVTSPIGPPPAQQPPYPNPNPTPSQYGQQAASPYGQQQQQQWGYGQPQQPQMYGQAQTPQPPASYASPPGGVGVQRGPSMNMHQYPGANPNQGGYQGVGGYQEPASTRRSPSPAPPGTNAPTGQYINGRPILFYGASLVPPIPPTKLCSLSKLLILTVIVLIFLWCTVKALYDYQASIDEEFDFQAGDVIAVTSTPEDGWWTGELLDDSRRVPGRTIFPSNFVCLF